MVMALLALLATATPALAQDESVAIELRMIEATTDGNAIDPKLADLEPYFNRFGPFTSFKALDTKSLTLAEGRVGKVALPDGSTLELTYRGKSKGYVKLRFELGDMKMNVRIHEGGFFFHSGVKHGKGRVVLAIKADPK
jgi:hypothetical protein